MPTLLRAAAAMLVAGATAAAILIATPIPVASAAPGDVPVTSAARPAAVADVAAPGTGLPGARPEEVGLDGERLLRLERALVDAVTRGQVPGMVALVARHGRLAWWTACGWRDREAGVPLTPADRFRFSSMTKPMTAAAVMILVEDGRLLLDDPVARYLPEFAAPRVFGGADDEPAAASGPIRVRHLLNHTSGYGYGSGPQGPLYHQADIEPGWGPVPGTVGEMVVRLARIPLLCEPGAEFHYGLSMDVAGHLVERVSGLTLEDFLRQRLWEPLGMRDTSFRVPVERLDQVAVAYFAGDDGMLVRDRADLHFLVDRIYYSGGSGVVGSAGDFLRFAQMILNRGELDGVRVLSRKAVERMTGNTIGDRYTPFRQGSGDKYGFGFGIRTEPGEHGGLESEGTLAWDGYLYTRFWIDPAEDLIGVLMAQSPGSWPTGLLDRCKVLVYQSIAD